MDELFTTLTTESCQQLYKDDPPSRLAILKALSSNPLENKPLAQTLGDNDGHFLTLLCLKFPNASEENEPLVVAGFLTKVSREKNPLPLLTEDSDIVFCAKALVSLALFQDALKKRWRNHGAPSPNFYRKTSKSVLKTKTKAHQAVSSHHEQWENFLFEQLQIPH